MIILAEFHGESVVVLKVDLYQAFDKALGDFILKLCSGKCNYGIVAYGLWMRLALDA